LKKSETKYQNAKRVQIEGLIFESDAFFGAISHLNETPRFGENDAVSLKKKEEAKTVSF
jgi:hypothetical protein